MGSRNDRPQPLRQVPSTLSPSQINPAVDDEGKQGHAEHDPATAGAVPAEPSIIVSRLWRVPIGRGEHLPSVGAYRYGF